MNFRKGLILVNVLVFGTIAIIITVALVRWVGTVIAATRQLSAREQAFHIAEAGIDYYRWHLAHAPTDYTNGTTTPGPYNFPFTDKDGNRIGQYSLSITPPPIGSTVVTIVATGTVDAYPGVARAIRAQLAIPSLAKFAVVANDVMRFGAGTEVFGPIHSNDGIRFDGIAHNLITSSVASYSDPDNPGPLRFGVYTTDSPTDPSPPSAVPNRPDVFMAGRQFPLPETDFVGLTTDLAQMKADAQANGRYFASSGSQGYRVLLKTNDTFDLYRVNTLVSMGSNCTKQSSEPSGSGWGSWSINTQTLLGNYAFPANGIIFLEDHVWVEGQINTARVTIVAARFPINTSTYRSITINNDLLYTNYDGRDVVALVAQNNINAGLRSQDDLRIDAALIAQNGRVGRYYYSNSGSGNSSCQGYHARDTITLYGMIASNKRYGFSYTDGTGYDIRNIIYDANMLYAPPPSFPLTTDQYSIISWEEVK